MVDKTYQKLSREEKRRQRRASAKYRLAHATRERMRVEVRGGSSLIGPDLPRHCALVGGELKAPKLSLYSISVGKDLL